MPDATSASRCGSGSDGGRRRRSFAPPPAPQSTPCTAHRAREPRRRSGVAKTLATGRARPRRRRSRDQAPPPRRSASMRDSAFRAVPTADTHAGSRSGRSNRRREAGEARGGRRCNGPDRLHRHNPGRSAWPATVEARRRGRPRSVVAASPWDAAQRQPRRWRQFLTCATATKSAPPTVRTVS